jgi:hypothetical protein
MPEYGVGYFYSINSGNGNAFNEVGKAIRAYITAKLQKPALPPVAPLPPGAAEFAGWYEPDSPRNEMTHFLERLAGLGRAEFNDGKLLFRSLGGWNHTFVPVAGRQFRYVPKKDPAEPVATVALVGPNQEGRFIEVGTATLKQIPAWLAILEIALTLFVAVSFVSILVYAPFWILGGLSKKRRRPPERAMRAWPLVAVLSVIGFVVIFNLCTFDLIPRLGNLTAWAMGLFLLTDLFALASIMSAIAVWRAPAGTVRAGVRGYSIAVTLALLITTAYFAYWGVIGLRTWV